MRTTLRKRNFSSSNTHHTRQPVFKKRKFNPNNDNSNSSFTQSQLASFHEQLMTIKNKHTPQNKPQQNTNTQKSNLPSKNQPNSIVKKQQNTPILKIDDDENKKTETATPTHKNVSTNIITSDINNCDDWNTFINSTDFNKNTCTPTLSNTKSESDNNTHNKSDLITKATVTETEWTDFLNNRYKNNNERNKDWKAPDINTFWEQGPIGMVHSWWNDNNTRKYVNHNLNQSENENGLQINKSDKSEKKLNKSEISKKKANKMIRQDIMKELKQQKLEKNLRDRIERGQIVKNIDDNAFESFFTSALEMGSDIRNGLVDIEKKVIPKKTKIFRPKLRKIKKIATFENDDLLFFDESESDSEEESMNKINENDMIYVHGGGVAESTALIASKLHSEHILLEQRVKIQHAQMVNVHVLDGDGVVEENVKEKNEIVSARILSDTVEDSLSEKRILRKLNVMDFVRSYKNAFFREVEELGLNVDALVDNWKVIKKHDGLSRKLRKKLGIIMARERVKRAKKCKVQEMIDNMVNEESDSSENTDDHDDICEFLDE